MKLADPPNKLYPIKYILPLNSTERARIKKQIQKFGDWQGNNSEIAIVLDREMEDVHREIYEHYLEQGWLSDKQLMVLHILYIRCWSLVYSKDGQYHSGHLELYWKQHWAIAQ